MRRGPKYSPADPQHLKGRQRRACGRVASAVGRTHGDDDTWGTDVVLAGQVQMICPRDSANRRLW